MHVCRDVKGEKSEPKCQLEPASTRYFLRSVFHLYTGGAFAVPFFTFLADSFLLRRFFFICILELSDFRNSSRLILFSSWRYFRAFTLLDASTSASETFLIDEGFAMLKPISSNSGSTFIFCAKSNFFFSFSLSTKN